MLPSPKIEKIPVRDYEFSRKITAEVENLNRCYQCSMCSDGCPVAYAMDYHPNEIIYMARMGLKEKVLQSKAIWVCVSCETCATRCPNEIDIVGLMDGLRKESLREGFNSSVNEIPQFHKVFMEEIRKRGRIHELRLIFRYKLKVGDFFSFKRIGEDASLGLKMFFKGKLKLLSPKVRRQKEVKGIFKKTLSDKRSLERVD